MMRRFGSLVTVFVIALQPAFAVGINASVSFGSPTIRLEAAETQLVTRTATIDLPQGQTRLALPLAELGVTPADVTLELSTPDVAWVSAVHTDTEGSYWTITTTADVTSSISLTYPIKGLTWTLGYVATLHEDGSVVIQAAVRITNGTGSPLDDARLIGEFTRATVSLQNGQSTTLEQPWLDASIRSEDVGRLVVYDPAIASTPMEMLIISGDIPERATALPAGDIRVYSAPEAGGEFLTQAPLPYTPPREPLQISLGPASGVAVTRTLAETKEVDKRLDARDRVVLFDQLETWTVGARSMREGPVDLLVRSHHEGAWLLEEASADVRRVDAETLEFVMPLLPDQQAEVTYRYRHLNRQP